MKLHSTYFCSGNSTYFNGKDGFGVIWIFKPWILM